MNSPARTSTSQPFGMWSVLLPADELARYNQLHFTRCYDESWEGVDHIVQLGHPKVVHVLAHFA